MTPPRVYIFGASGVGTTTLGGLLAQKLSVPHVDCDDHYWAPDKVPFSQKRAPSERVASMELALGDKGWVLSGSCNTWASAITDKAQLLVFVHAPTPLRLERLAKRQSDQFRNRIDPGGDMHKIHRDFLDWAAGYDDPDFASRNRARHEAWLKEERRPVCRVNGAQPLETSLTKILSDLPSRA